MTDGIVTNRRIAVAHLRGGKAAFEALRNAIDKLQLLGEPVADGTKPN